MGLLNSEWIKLRSTKSPYWLYGLGIAFVVGLGAIFGKVDTTVTIDGAGTMGFITVFAMFAVGVFLQSFVWVMAIIAVTGEYRYGTNKTTFLAAPRRWDAFLAKSVVTALVTAVVSAVAIAAGVLVGSMFSSGNGWSVTSGEGLRYLLRFPVFFAVGALGCIGLAHILRNAAGAVAIMLVWTLAVEDLLPQLPKVGKYIDSWVPFGNGRYWVLGDTAKFGIDWGQTTALGWYALVCVLVWLLGLLVVLKRDA